MQIGRVGTGAPRVAPFAAGPRVEVLLGERPNGRMGAVHVTLPAGGAMPEHAHGDSEAIVVSLTGRVVLRGDDRQETLEPGALAAIGVGERVSLANAGPEPATLLAVFAPADFVRALAAWPAAGAR